jgi:hypothetical protein
LLERLLVYSDQDDGVRSLSVLSRLLDLLNNVLATGKVDEGGGAQLLKTHLLLLVAGVDGDDPQTHGLRVLLGEGSESTTSTDDGDSLPWASVGLLKSLVDGDTGAKYGCYGIEGNVFVKAGDVSSLGNAVLLEGTIDGVAGEESFGAKRLIWMFC